MTFRCFIALELPADLKEMINADIQKLRPLAPGIRWVSAGNLHLTLKFLGDVEEGRIEEIKNILANKLSHYAPVCIKICGAGAFPSAGSPKVLWVGIKENPELSSIHNDIEKSLAAFGFEADNRRFTGHITIGRVKPGKKNPALAPALAGLTGREYGEFVAHGISIMKSELRPAGPVYTCLSEILLTGRADVQ